MNTLEKWQKRIAKRWHGDQKMIDYCNKKRGELVELENGRIVEIEKPSIKTQFCFDDSYDFNGAQDMAMYARTNEDYFREANLRDIDRLIEEMHKPGIVLYSAPKYTDDSVLAYVYTTPEWHWEHGCTWNGAPLPEEAEALTEKDVEAYYAALETTKEKFNKRITTYLKRYGMTKVHSWTYWGDR